MKLVPMLRALVIDQNMPRCGGKLLSKKPLTRVEYQYVYRHRPTEASSAGSEHTSVRRFGTLTCRLEPFDPAMGGTKVHMGVADWLRTWLSSFFALQSESEIMAHGSSEEHRRLAARRGPISLALFTVSDSRTFENDENGRYLRARIESAGHLVAAYRIVKDDPAQVLDSLDEAVAASARIILFNGGTGISRRDSTYDAISARLQKTLPGFGELFRILSWEQVGAAAMLSRAVAGIYAGAVVVSMPGSPAAVKLAWERLLEPEIEHLAWEVGR